MKISSIIGFGALSSSVFLNIAAHAVQTHGTLIADFDYTPYEHNTGTAGIFFAPDYNHPKAGIGWSSKALDVVLYGPWKVNGIPVKKTFGEGKRYCSSSLGLKMPTQLQLSYMTHSKERGVLYSMATLLPQDPMYPSEEQSDSINNFWLEYDWKNLWEKIKWEFNPFFWGDSSSRPTTLNGFWSLKSHPNYVWCVESISIREPADAAPYFSFYTADGATYLDDFDTE